MHPGCFVWVTKLFFPRGDEETTVVLPLFAEIVSLDSAFLVTKFGIPVLTLCDDIYVFEREKKELHGFLNKEKLKK